MTGKRADPGAWLRGWPKVEIHVAVSAPSVGIITSAVLRRHLSFSLYDKTVLKVKWKAWDLIEQQIGSHGVRHIARRLHSDHSRLDISRTGRKLPSQARPRMALLKVMSLRSDDT